MNPFKVVATIVYVFLTVFGLILTITAKSLTFFVLGLLTLGVMWAFVAVTSPFFGDNTAWLISHYLGLP